MQRTNATGSYKKSPTSLHNGSDIAVKAEEEESLNSSWNSLLSIIKLICARKTAESTVNMISL